MGEDLIVKAGFEYHPKIVMQIRLQEAGAYGGYRDRGRIDAVGERPAITCRPRIALDSVRGNLSRRSGTRSKSRRDSSVAGQKPNCRARDQSGWTRGGPHGFL